MENTKGDICRLCLEISSDNILEVLSETHNIQILYIIPELNLSNSRNPVLCGKCIESLQESYDFKTACVEIEGYLQHFISSAKKLDLEEVVSHKMFAGEVKQELKELKGRNKICRLCLGLIEDDSFKEFNIIEDNILQKCVPEVDLTLTDNPISCETCMEYLHQQFNFVMRCQYVDETVNKYFMTQDASNCSQVNLHEVLKFSSETDHVENVEDYLKDFYQLEDKDVIIKTEYKDVGHARSNEMKMEPDFENFTNALNEEEIHIKNENNIIEDRLSTALYKCEVCSYVTDRKYSLRMHMIMHTKPEEIIMYKCSECSYQTKRKGNLLIHMVKHKKPTEITMHQCMECSYQTKLRTNLRKHQLKHKAPEEIMMHQCQHCEYKGKLKENLVRHMIRHKTPQELVMHKCSECPYETKLKNNLTKHMVVHKSHNEVTMYKCKDCDYQSKWKSHLQRHKLIHNSEELNTYKCDHCSYVANQKCYLKRHLLAHKNPSEIMMFKCDLCDFQTKRKDKIKTHMDNMHNCSACAYQTRDKEDLLNHMQSHEFSDDMYKCDVCTYRAKQKRYVQRHRRTHFENPDEIVWHKCNYCSYQTRRKDVLNTHLLTHKDPSELEMHKCSICPFQTKRKHTLVLHNRTHCKTDLGK